MPYAVSGKPASSTDSNTWATFDNAFLTFGCADPQYTGIGYVFAEDDGLCGIDLDGCRDPATGAWADWARPIVERFNTYAEVSPSGSGVKLFIRGKPPLSSGKNRKLEGVAAMGGKEPGVEVYWKGRYFAVTGQVLAGMPREPQERQDVLDAYCKEWFPAPVAPVHEPFDSPSQILGRARQYVAKMPGAVSGQGGHNTTFRVACVLVMGFGLSSDEAYSVLAEWNQTCDPPWTERELRHKIDSASKQGGPRNYLRDVPLNRLPAAKVPTYQCPPPPPEPKSSITIDAAASKYLDSLLEGKQPLVSLGVGAVDNAIGGGLAFGEMVVIAARPGHGKTCVGLQAAYSASHEGHPVLIISEEMSRIALGKRAIQFSSDVPEESWRYQTENVRSHIKEYFADRAPIFVVESCATVERAVQTIRQHVTDHGVRFVVIDYGQLLQGAGRTKYEQISDVSVTIRRLVTELNITVVMLCQLNRAVEGRDKFVPRMGDLRDSGQIEQDADVIMFLLWPHRLDSNQNPHDYMIFVAKNRSRPILASTVKCRFEPSRQMVEMERPNRQETEYDHLDEF